MKKKINFKIKLVDKNAKIPSYARNTDTGADLVAVTDTIVPAKGTVLVDTGIQVECLEEGYDIQVRSRSGLATKGIHVLNAPGTIDYAYRGNVKVILHNTTDKDFCVGIGDRIAQMVVAPVYQASFEVAETLSDTDRGAGGFGSTGR